MRVLVCPHELTIGGSQINAIDLAAELVGRGIEVEIYGRPGPLVDYIEAHGLRFHEANDTAVRPAPQRMAELARLARRRRYDLIHAYEWPPCLDAYFGVHLPFGIPVACTVLSMHVPAEIPSTVPLAMGTEQLRTEAAMGGRRAVEVLVPPIDVDGDHPGTDGRAWRAGLGVDPRELLVVTVSRLSRELKFDALNDLIDAADQLAVADVVEGHPLRVVMVGDGDAGPSLRRRADEVNAAHGRDVILLPGAMADPRPAYAAADVVVGMGSSALRAMAHGRPVVVQGERGWSMPCEPNTMTTFHWQGFYGIGDGRPGGPDLVDHLVPLLTDVSRRADVGAWGRSVVVDEFSLTRCADRLDAWYRLVCDRPVARRRQVGSATRVAWTAARTEFDLHRPIGRAITNRIRPTRTRTRTDDH